MTTCLVPFNQLYIHSSGEVYPCNFLQNNSLFKLGHIQENSLREIWEGEKLKNFRQQHLESLPARCQRNQETFFCSQINLRSSFNFDSQKLKRLDIMLDSRCNLACIMCTNIYDKTGGLRGDYFWENNDDIFSQLDELELVGGEPIISPYFDRIVKRVSPLNPQCNWLLTTNAHYNLSPQILANFKRINLSTLSISLDSLEPGIFEKIRVRSTFKVVMNNIQTLKKVVPKIFINMVIQKDNCNEVFKMYRWCREEGFSFYPILLLYPDEFSIVNRQKEVNKEWILKLIDENSLIKSKEIFVIIKKAISNLSLQKDKEVLIPYLKHVEVMEAL